MNYQVNKKSSEPVIDWSETVDSCIYDDGFEGLGKYESDTGSRESYDLDENCYRITCGDCGQVIEDEGYSSASSAIEAAKTLANQRVGIENIEEKGNIKAVIVSVDVVLQDADGEFYYNTVARVLARLGDCKTYVGTADSWVQPKTQLVRGVA